MFCGIKKLIECQAEYASGLVDASMQDLIEIRRFGIIQNGTPITYDDFGEPVNLLAQQNYKTWQIKVDMDFEDQLNDEKSNVGGRPATAETLSFGVTMTEDIIENDVVIYPIGSNKTYRVKEDKIIPKKLRRIIKCISEVKTTK